MRAPLDALADEARRSNLSLLITRDGKLVFEHRGSSTPDLVFVLSDLLRRLAVGDEGVAWNLTPELYEQRVYGPLGIAPDEHVGSGLSLRAAERVTRAFADSGVLDGRRIFAESIVANIANDPQTPVFQQLGEGELAVITRPIFDSWRAIPSIHRETLTAVEPLVDLAVPIDDFTRVMDEKLGKQGDAFRNEISKAKKNLFERRWESTFGFGAFGYRQAVVVLPQTRVIAVYLLPHDGYGSRTLVPLLRALE